MDDVWLVVREEKHVDPKYLVCASEEIAIGFAEKMAAYWRGQYRVDVDETAYGDAVFMRSIEDGYSIRVLPPQSIIQ